MTLLIFTGYKKIGKHIPKHKHTHVSTQSCLEKIQSRRFHICEGRTKIFKHGLAENTGFHIVQNNQKQIEIREHIQQHHLMTIITISSDKYQTDQTEVPKIIIIIIIHSFNGIFNISQ